MDKELRRRVSRGKMAVGHLEGCGALIYCRETQRYLFLLRANHKHRDSWGLAGGKIESNETVATALVREINEEIGLDVSAYKLRPLEKFTSDDGGFVYHTLMIVVDHEFSPQLNHEHRGYCWVPLDCYPRPLHPGVWRTFSFDAVVKKIRTVEGL